MAQLDPKKSLNDSRHALIAPLQKVKVSDLKNILANKPIILDSKTEPKKAIEILVNNNVVAAPVLDKEKRTWVGVLDIRNLVKYVISKADAEKPPSKKAQHAMDYITTSPVVATNTLQYLCRMSPPFKAVRYDDPAINIMRVLASGSHIVGICKGGEQDAQLMTICTQGQFYESVCEGAWQLNQQGLEHPSVAVTLEELIKHKFAASPVKMVPADMQALEVFKRMSQNNLSGLAVVDEDGALVHNTSATDIKLWLKESHSLEDTIEEFLVKVRQQQKLKAKYPFTNCNLKDSLGKAMSKLQVTGYHRVWITDDEKKPVGVLALTDIFRFLVAQDEE